MLLRSLVTFANAFVVAYAADAGFSLLEEVFRATTGSELLLPLRNLLAGAVVTASPLALLAMTATRRLLPSVLVPLALSALWMGYGAAPLPILVAPSALGFPLLVLQASVALYAFARIRSATKARSWLFESAPPESSNGAAAFSPLYSAVALSLVTVVGSTLVLVYLPLLLMTALQSMTDGFVRFDQHGIGLADRRYARDGRELRLVGMMHIGESEGYSALVGTFSESSTVVLAEGVSDDAALLEEDISYEGLAKGLGLDTQGSIEAYLDELEADAALGEERLRPVVRHADVDVSVFHPETRELLEELGRVWKGDELVSAFFSFVQENEDRPERFLRLREDILDLRNLHLLEQIEVALAEDFERIVVPWGAMHLPYIQAKAVEMGFERTTESHHPLASWSTILAALLSSP